MHSQRLKIQILAGYDKIKGVVKVSYWFPNSVLQFVRYLVLAHQVKDSDGGNLVGIVPLWRTGCQGENPKICSYDEGILKLLIRLK